jgi:hypothetical protein
MKGTSFASGRDLIISGSLYGNKNHRAHKIHCAKSKLEDPITTYRSALSN